MPHSSYPAKLYAAYQLCLTASQQPVNPLNKQASEHLQISNVLILGQKTPTTDQLHVNLLFNTKMLLKTKPVVTITEKIFSPGRVDREPIMVSCPEPILQQFFLRMSNSKAFLCTAASQDSPPFCVSTVVPGYTHTLFSQYFPEVPEFLYLHLVVVKQKKPLHLFPPLQQQQLREDTAALPLWEVRRDTPRSNPRLD